VPRDRTRRLLYTEERVRAMLDELAARYAREVARMRGELNEMHNRYQHKYEALLREVADLRELHTTMMARQRADAESLRRQRDRQAAWQGVASNPPT